MHEVCKKDVSEGHDYLTCPFCLSHCIEARHGKSRCPVCRATFEIDDRVECLSADTDSINMPVSGIVCGCCGLVQSGSKKNCLYCGVGITAAVH